MSDPTPAATLFERPCPFITFYSFKGGVGRSMAAINVAGIIAARGFRVMVVDMDLEAPGLSFLANQPLSEGEPRRLQPGFVDFLLDAIDRGEEADLFKLSPADAIQRYSAPYELPEGFRRSPEGSLHIMPAGQIDDDYAGRLTRLDLPSLYRDGTGLALIQAFKQVVQDSKLFDYVFIDSRTGFSDESGICTRDLADCLMVVSGLNKQNVEGTSRFLSTLRHATESRKPLEVILSPIPNGEDALVDEREQQAGKVFAEAWGQPVRTELHIPYHPQLALTEEPHIFRRRRGYLFDAYNRIEQGVFELLGERFEDTYVAAIGALYERNYGIAEALLRRVSKLADTQAWMSTYSLINSTAWLADTNADAVFGFLLEQASSDTTEELGQLIGFAADVRRVNEPDVAKLMYERALEAAPSNTDILGSYANLRLSTGQVNEGMKLIDRALTIRASAPSPIAIDAECWMYVFCCGAPDRRLGALQRLRRLVQIDSISNQAWDFTGVINQALAMAHPDATWLPILADVLGGRVPATALDDWPAWRAAAPE